MTSCYIKPKAPKNCEKKFHKGFKEYNETQLSEVEVGGSEDSNQTHPMFCIATQTQTHP